MVAVAIGVGSAEGLKAVPAAVNCARKFSEWADALWYEVTLITDEMRDRPVTVDRLRREFEAILMPPGPIHRMIVYFAGHGMIKEAEQGLWFLSDSKKEGLAVAQEPLRRKLATYDIDQIAIFSDACRSLPRSMRELEHEERSVLAFGPKTDGDPHLDKFVAARDGQQTYAIPGSTEADDVCVFSGVLLEALWGTRPDAFSTLAPDKVTSSSLGTYLRAEVPRAAKRYGLTIRPSVLAAFPEGDNVYFTAGPTSGGTAPFDWPPPPQPPLAPGFRLLSALPDWVDGVLAPPLPHGPGSRGAAAEAAPESGPSLFQRVREQELPAGLRTGAGVAIDGAAIRCLWTPGTVAAAPHHHPGWWEVWTSDDARLRAPAPVLIEFDDGRFAAVTALPDFITGAVCDERGVSALTYRHAYDPSAALGAEMVIDRLERGVLRADAVTDLAALLRREKHLDPVLGVFAAYLYDSIGEVGSIRRMACFYAQYGQAIPYDVALLAQLHCHDEGGQRVAHVPPVPRREPRSAEEQRHSWTYEATPAADGIVGGGWPWLRQGWAFLADPTANESTLIRRGLEKLSRHLKRSRFATLDHDGGLALANLFQLVPRTPQPTAEESRPLVRA